MTDDVRRLYHGPLEDFVARRTALAKERRPEDAAAAAAIAKLRKPSVTAWAVDQVAATEPALVAELLAAGADARDAQQAAADGSAGGDGLREAVGRVRRAVDAASAAAMACSTQPVSEESERRIRMTLQSAATGSAAQRLALWRGALDRDVEPAGFAVPSGVDDADAPELAAAIRSLRVKPASPGSRRDARGQRAAPSDGGRATADRAAARRATELRETAARARAVADAKREHADRVAEAARIAVAEAESAERAARGAERAAGAVTP